MGFITIFHDGGNDDKGDQYRVISRRGTFHRPPKTPASTQAARDHCSSADYGTLFVAVWGIMGVHVFFFK